LELIISLSTLAEKTCSLIIITRKVIYLKIDTTISF
jgi:hypothetical protein